MNHGRLTINFSSSIVNRLWSSTHLLPASSTQWYGLSQLTSLTISRPSRPAHSRAICNNASAQVPLVERAAFCVPLSRNLRVNHRVSTPLIPGTPWWASQSDKESAERQFDTTGLRERVTAAETCGLIDSSSSKLIPTLPRCETVNNTA